MAENTTQRDIPKKKGKSYEFWKPDNYTGRVNAKWDSNNTRVFLQACADEIRKGNRGPQYLTNKGWDGLLESFYNSTEIYYDQKQMRNKWDILKQDYTAWCVVQKGATGLGWDPSKGTIVAPDPWWDDLAKKYKSAKKFKEKALEHPDLNEILFGGRTATGACQWTPTEYTSPVYEQGSDDFMEYASTFDGDSRIEEEQHHTTPEVNIPVDEPYVALSSERNRERVDQTVGNNALKNKRARLSSAASLNNTLERIVGAVENQTNEVTVKHYADTCNTTVDDCIEKLDNLPGLIYGSPLYLLGADLMSTPGNRLVFMKLRTDEVRLGWLQTKQQDRNALMASFRFNAGDSCI